MCVSLGDAPTPPAQPPVEPGTHVPSNFGDCITCASLLETTRLRVAPNQQHPWRNGAAHRRAAFRCVNVVQCARACIGMDGSASCRVFNRGRSWSIVVNRGLHSFIRDLAAQGSIVSIIVGQRTSLETRPGMSCVGTRSEAITSVVPNGRHSYEVS